MDRLGVQRDGDEEGVGWDSEINSGFWIWGNDITESNGITVTYRLMNIKTPAFEVRNAFIELIPHIDKDCAVAYHGPMAGYDGRNESSEARAAIRCR
jgi:hypothetical protein